MARDLADGSRITTSARADSTNSRNRNDGRGNGTASTSSGAAPQKPGHADGIGKRGAETAVGDIERLFQGGCQRSPLAGQRGAQLQSALAVESDAVRLSQQFFCGGVRLRDAALRVEQQRRIRHQIECNRQMPLRACLAAADQKRGVEGPAQMRPYNVEPAYQLVGLSGVAR